VIIKDEIHVAHNCDFVFIRHGSISLLHPVSTAAEEWVGDNIPLEGDTQFWGNAIVIEPRYVDGILNGISGDGLVVSSHNDTIN